MFDVFYILRGLVYVQPFIWLIIFNEYEPKEEDQHILHVAFYYFIFSTVVLLGVTQFSFSQYSNKLLYYYTAFLAIAYEFLRFKYNAKDSICLAFIIVFINSYYWEMMMHFNAIIFYGISFNDFVQMFHLIPAYLLYRRIIVKNRKRFNILLIAGLIIGDINLILHAFLRSPYGYRFEINMLNRISCLCILLFIIVYLVDIRKRKIVIDYEAGMIFEKHKTV